MGLIWDSSRPAGTFASATHEPTATPAMASPAKECTKKQLAIKATVATSFARGSRRWMAELAE